jgi:hypothetical protein
MMQAVTLKKIENIGSQMGQTKKKIKITRWAVIEMRGHSG